MGLPLKVKRALALALACFGLIASASTIVFVMSADNALGAMAWPPLLAAALLLASAASVQRSPSVIADLARQTLFWENLAAAARATGRCRLGEMSGVRLGAATSDGDTDVLLSIRISDFELPLGQLDAAIAVERIQAIERAAGVRTGDWLEIALSNFAKENPRATVIRRLNTVASIARPVGS
jgi:hypothetical protein